MIKNIKPVKIKQPHFIWPPKDEKISKKIYTYFLNYKNGKNGLPDSIENLEAEFCKFNKNKYALALSSGTAALHVAYLSIGLKKGDEVIISDYTFPATLIPLFLLNVIPVLCDVDQNDANIDPDCIEKLITNKTKAIVVTHWWGQPCNMKKILKICKKYKLKLIEDCAHSPGAKFLNKNVGSFGDFGCFSFDNNKLLASGEGGMLTTNNYNLYQKAILYSDFGPRLYNSITVKKLRNFIQTGIGTKYRIHFLAAKIAGLKLKNINKLNSQRKKLHDYFNSKLKNSKLFKTPRDVKDFKRGGFYGYKVLVKNDKIKINDLIKLLISKNLDARKTETPPLHLTNTFKILNYKKNYFNICKIKKGFLKNSKWFHENHVSFPTFYDLKHKKIIDEYCRVIYQIERELKI
jgi:dTDP-4-amino-4,6-dideoxygalactose transaminase